MFGVTRRVLPLLATPKCTYDATRRVLSLLISMHEGPGTRQGGYYPSLPRQYACSRWQGGCYPSSPLGYMFGMARRVLPFFATSICVFNMARRVFSFLATSIRVFKEMRRACPSSSPRCICL